jgi:hypothetical protein
MQTVVDGDVVFPIGPTTVVQWLKESAPNWRPLPSPVGLQVAELTSEINLIYRKMQTAYPPKLAKRNAHDASLHRELADSLEPIPRIIRQMQERGLLVADELDWAAALADAASNLLQSGLLADSSGGKQWHAAARMIARKAVPAWASVGRKEVSHKKVDAPLVQFVVHVLSYVLPDGQDAPTHVAVAGVLKRTLAA